MINFSTELSDNFVRVVGLINNDTGMYINDATITCTVTDAGGTPITGQTWPLTLAYEAGSNGVYRGVLEDVASLTPGANYLAKITCVGNGINKYWEVPFQHLIDTGSLGG